MTFIPMIALAVTPADFSADQTDLLNLVNGYRQRHGIESVTLHDGLCQVATGHAGFMDANNILTHEEQEGKKGFIGINLATRSARIGWNDELSELVGFSNSGLSETVQAIFDSPCHRVRFLKPGNLTLGASAQGEFVCLLVGGEANKKVVLSPPDRAENVPTDWSGASDLSGTKSGPGGTTFGYPIVYIDTTGRSGSFVTQEASLTGPHDEKIPVVLRDPSNDKRFPTSLTMVPKRPLQNGTQYRVTISVKFAGEAEKKSTWTFRTSDKKVR